MFFETCISRTMNHTLPLLKAGCHNNLVTYILLTDAEGLSPWRRVVRTFSCAPLYLRWPSLQRPSVRFTCSHWSTSSSRWQKHSCSSRSSDATRDLWHQRKVGTTGNYQIQNRNSIFFSNLGPSFSPFWVQILRGTKMIEIGRVRTLATTVNRRTDNAIQWGTRSRQIKPLVFATEKLIMLL